MQIYIYKFICIIYILYIDLKLMNVKIPTSFLWPVVTRSISHRIYRVAFKNAFPVAFNFSEICDRSVFNLNHYLLLSYSRMNKVIKINII